MRKVTITEVNKINKLEFELPNEFGVYILVGKNGAGKTTLLNCLDRICNPRAFATGFNISKRMQNIDQYNNSVIEYEVNGIIENSDYSTCNSMSERQRAKSKFSVAIKLISKTAGISEEVATIDLIDILVKQKSIGEIKRVMLPMIRYT